jgi:Zn-dependent M28 family amino/carboxypeptidase
MKVKHSHDRPQKAPDPAVEAVLRGVSPKALRAYVNMLAFPRHYVAEKRANRRARDLLLKRTRSFGYRPFLQGRFDNVVLVSGDGRPGPSLLLGAHYDSVPGSPGADDNASAVAVCLESARLIREYNIGSVMIVFFNREEDGLLGSSEFVAQLARRSDCNLKEAHIFEMVGYRDRAPGSQTMPAGLPIRTRDVGDFLALLANRASNGIAEDVLTLAASYVPQSIVVALKIYLGVERYFGHLNRSDHTPFWRAGIPTIMWTDTSEFRNPHYHLASDKPGTLDYDFMSDVAKLVLARVVSVRFNAHGC